MAQAANRQRSEEAKKPAWRVAMPVLKRTTLEMSGY
jgi:hypothetical protein